MDKEEKRESWGSRVDFLLSCVGFCVGFGNIWRFSYLCYKHGGGAFLLPYLCCVLVIGFPIQFLEVAIGQFTRRGAVGIWDVCPLMRGIGYCTMLFSALESVYYNVILSWTGYYFILSFFPSLPWAHCRNDWNTDKCSVGGDTLNRSAGDTDLISVTNYTAVLHVHGDVITDDANATDGGAHVTHPAVTEEAVTHPAVEFWWRGVLKLTEGIESPGEVSTQLLASLAVFWVIVFCCVVKGVRWSGKVVYFTATVPYVLMLALLIQALRQEGSLTGLSYYLTPQFDRLGDIKVWFDAASQVLFSYAVALTVLPAYGSYCPFNSNCFRDSIIVAIANSLTSFLAGFVVFSMLGHMAHVQQQSIDVVATSGPGLVFVVYPQALSLLPLPNVWSVLFFFMMILVGLDSQFAAVEGILTSLGDVFPRWLRWRAVILCVFVLCAFLLGISMVTGGGMYVFQLLDYYLFGSYVAQLLAFLEVVSVAWIYGANRFYDDIELMVGYRIGIWMKICWKYLTPVTMTVLILFNLATYQPLTYNKTYVFPGWANGLGFLLSGLVLLVIPLVFLLVLARTPADGLLERLRKATQSTVDHADLKKNCQGDETEGVDSEMQLESLVPPPVL
ncbi:sodium- and chloride-dependent taurine transporter-like [Babylonia areolata]|uniref:sodium- and chloride-dependent taurine transporter-like n=1 Tax=Babylonia areolata TaxID=304850 RepID=UPI003FCF03E9